MAKKVKTKNDIKNEKFAKFRQTANRVSFEGGVIIKLVLLFLLLALLIRMLIFADGESLSLPKFSDLLSYLGDTDTNSTLFNSFMNFSFIDNIENDWGSVLNVYRDFLNLFISFFNVFIFFARGVVCVIKLVTYLIVWLFGITSATALVSV